MNFVMLSNKQSIPSYFSEPKTEILGAPDLYINRGSTINLTCVVLLSPEPPAFIFWNHNDAVSIDEIFKKINMLFIR